MDSQKLGLWDFVRRLTDRLARPDLLRPGELSPYLQRDIGLDDGRTGRFSLPALTRPAASPLCARSRPGAEGAP